MRLMTTKFRKQIHLDELTQMRLIKHVLVKSSIPDHVILKIYCNFPSSFQHEL